MLHAKEEKLTEVGNKEMTKLTSTDQYGAGTL